MSRLSDSGYARSSRFIRFANFDYPQDRHATLDLPDPVFPATIVGDQESWKAEAQYILNGDGFNVIVGASYFDGNARKPLVSPPFEFASESDPHHLNAYGYFFYAPQPIDRSCRSSLIR
jgi:hypothetical protein